MTSAPQPSTPASAPPASIAERVASIRAEIARACERVGRDPASVTLLGASKQQPIESIAEACAAGLADFGENWGQELVPKAEAAAALALHPRWHFIGHLQRNKVREVLPHIVALHSLDSERLARELERQLAARGATTPLRCYIEVNVAGEASKDGITPDALPALLAVVRDCPHLEATGLMTVPPADDEAQARACFRGLAALLNTAQNAFRAPAMLSMGMSDDLETAIAAGATFVRVGSAIFGPRAEASSVADTSLHRADAVLQGGADE